MSLLPTINSGVELRAALDAHALWPAAADLICARHKLPRGELTRPKSGSFPVLFLGSTLVIKLVPRRWRLKYEAELATLQHVQGRLSIATPEVVAEGEVDGWSYLVMTALPGKSLTEVWAKCSPESRLDVARSLGELMASMHALPTTGLDELRVDWPRFVDDQTATAGPRHEASGADPRWIAEMPSYLARVTPELRASPHQVLMSADIHDEHVLVSQRDGRWVTTGLFDFGDAMIGDADYDLVTPVTFIIRGDAGLMAALLDGYGVSKLTTDDAQALRRRGMAYTLLHRFGQLRREVDRLRLGEEPDSLEQIERALWPIEPR